MTQHQGQGEQGAVTNTMEVSTGARKDDPGKTSRPVRNRRYTRRGYVTGQRPQKRLFTPEIKRYLKDWLVRRRDNPYPNRDEKKNLAKETGLTYIQICNWFANWRRKLKNVNIDINEQTWGHLIRTYNDRAQGNVEQFSICSEDSIWSEPDLTHDDDFHRPRLSESPDSFNYRTEYKESSGSSTASKESEAYNNNTITHHGTENEIKSIPSPLLLSKWLESAARFQPSEPNYSWWAEERRKRPEKIQKPSAVMAAWSSHDRDEVEAAVALTTLAAAAPLPALSL